MAYVPKILAFAGSTRVDSFNKKLVKLAAAGARAFGAEVTALDLRDLPMPLYDGDLEANEGIPPNARTFKKLMLAHQGLLISAPEYNSGISGVLKNAIDWASRSAAGEVPLACFVGKVASLMSASPGALGGLRGLVHVRLILSNIHVLVLPDQIAVPRAHEAFNPEGMLKDPKQQASIEKLGRDLRARPSTSRALRCGTRRPDARTDDAGVPAVVRQGGGTPQMAGGGRNHGDI